MVPSRAAPVRPTLPPRSRAPRCVYYAVARCVGAGWARPHSTISGHDWRCRQVLPVGIRRRRSTLRSVVVVVLLLLAIRRALRLVAGLFGRRVRIVGTNIASAATTTAPIRRAPVGQLQADAPAVEQRAVQLGQRALRILLQGEQHKAIATAARLVVCGRGHRHASAAARAGCGPPGSGPCACVPASGMTKADLIGAAALKKAPSCAPVTLYGRLRTNSVAVHFRDGSAVVDAAAARPVRRAAAIRVPSWPSSWSSSSSTAAAVRVHVCACAVVVAIRSDDDPRPTDGRKRE